jgi:hypothetical protein
MDAKPVTCWNCPKQFTITKRTIEIEDGFLCPECSKEYREWEKSIKVTYRFTKLRRMDDKKPSL